MKNKFEILQNQGYPDEGNVMIVFCGKPRVSVVASLLEDVRKNIIFVAYGAEEEVVLKEDHRPCQATKSR